MAMRCCNRHVCGFVLVVQLAHMSLLCGLEVGSCRMSLVDHGRMDWKAGVTVVRPEGSTTVVSALYDINRQTNGDGRSMEDYLRWWKETLTYKGPMVVYVGSREHVDFVRTARKGLPTHVLMRPLEQLKYYNLRYIMSTLQSSDKWKPCKALWPSRMEYVNDLYSLLSFMKFVFMDEVATINPYHTQYFFWFDAGISRFWRDIRQIQSGTWPSAIRLKELDPDGEKVIIKRDSIDDTNGKRIDDSFHFMCGSGRGFMGGVFGGTGPALSKMLHDAEDFLYQEILAAGAVGNEQMFYAVLHSRDKSRIAAWDEPALEFADWLSDDYVARHNGGANV